MYPPSEGTNSPPNRGCQDDPDSLDARPIQNGTGRRGRRGELDGVWIPTPRQFDEAGMLMLLLVAVTALGAMAGVLVFILLEWDV